MGEVKKYFWDMNMVIWPIFTALVFDRCNCACSVVSVFVWLNTLDVPI
ncbi:hypothetical protein MSIBF_A3620005 [groundwater metagenome]|uniref:Uncharacterized protein n=1 Tax=groundwater metagenome TaxID=717931 RepID=A0A098EBA9_9ZZZZ